MVQSKTLKNGVRVIVKRMEGLLSVTMGILVGTGSAYETDEEDGISHFIEHMQFKGTDTRTAFEISDGFDALGAQVNAFTGKDMTCYYAKSTSDHATETFSLLADLFLNSTFPDEEMKREKGVVVEEINMSEDTPDDLCLELLARAAYGNENYGRNILGPAKNVKGFSRENIFDYKKKRYRPENIVVSFAGNIEPQEAEELAERYFGGIERGEFENKEKKVVWHSDRVFRKKQIEQVHFALGFPTVARDHGDYAALQVMTMILGGGMSSRLFKKVREELGLAYSVYSYSSHYEETGIYTIYAGVNPQKAESALGAVKEVLEEFVKDGCTQEEFLRGKEQIRSGKIYSQENTASQMLLYGRQMLYENEEYDFEEKMREIADLKMDDVLRVIRTGFDLSRACIATVGNLKKGLAL